MAKLSYFKCRRCSLAAKNPFRFCPQCQAEDSFDERSIDDFSAYRHKPAKIDNERAAEPRIIIDKSFCAGQSCSRCVKACKPKAIRMKTKAAVDNSMCISCLLCIQQCPNRAIYFADSIESAKRAILEGEKR